MGTFGYVAPKYACTEMLTKKSDVYNFRILIIDIITGKSPVDYSKPQGEELIDLNLLEKPFSKALKLFSVGCS
ncbi:hypothetical protein HN51_030971 [Arachis hypogaea]